MRHRALSCTHNGFSDKSVTSVRGNGLTGIARSLIACLALFAWASVDVAHGARQPPTFPGAEGYGAVAIGGRGGRVIKVTNMNASGPGSLQAACAAKGPRIVVFAVAGVIRGDVKILEPRITIAGESAPAPGVTIAGRLIAESSPEQRLHDLVVRFVRIRPPPATDKHDGDAIQFAQSERIMLDHLSLSWANDEMIDIIQSSDVTVQWSTIEESDPAGHAKGAPHNFAIFSAYPGSGRVSIHHNLFAHHARRLPSLSPQLSDGASDFRNNVVYNFRDGFSHEGHEPKAPINLVANYYKRGPDAETVFPFHLDRAGRYHVVDNYIEGAGLITDLRSAPAGLPDWVRIGTEGQLLREAARVAPVTTWSAREAYRRVLRQAGAWPRDRVTLRTIEEVRAGSGRWGRHAPAAPGDEWFLEGLAQEKPAPDSDGDGMPDIWENRHGLDPRDASDQNRLMASGYTAIEQYLHMRAADLMKHAR